MAGERKFVIVEKRDRVAKIIFNRPEKKNALNEGALTEIVSVLKELRHDDSVSVVLTTGAGEEAYCAGRDLTELPKDRQRRERHSDQEFGDADARVPVGHQPGVTGRGDDAPTGDRVKSRQSEETCRRPRPTARG